MGTYSFRTGTYSFTPRRFTRFARLINTFRLTSQRNLRILNYKAISWVSILTLKQSEGVSWNWLECDANLHRRIWSNCPWSNFSWSSYDCLYFYNFEHITNRYLFFHAGTFLGFTLSINTICFSSQCDLLILSYKTVSGICTLLL